jgi:hypothetical protein
MSDLLVVRRAHLGALAISADEIFFATGNATFAPSSHEWRDTLLATHSDATSTGGVPIDSYTPASFQQLQNEDLDLGSTEPALFPVGANTLVPHLAVQGGKDSVLRLLNLDNLSGSEGPATPAVKSVGASKSRRADRF